MTIDALKCIAVHTLTGSSIHARSADTNDTVGIHIFIDFIACWWQQTVPSNRGALSTDKKSYAVTQGQGAL